MTYHPDGYKLTSERDVVVYSLSEYFRLMRKELEINVGHVKRRDFYPIGKIAESLNISKNMLQKKINGEKTLTRDWLIAICAAHGLDNIETDDALLISGMARLDAEQSRENYLISFLCELRGSPVGIADLNKSLAEAGFSELDVNRHRIKNKIEQKAKKSYFPYRFINKVVRTYIDEGDQYQSLSTAYDFRQRCEALLFLEKDIDAKITLVSCSDGTMIVETFPCTGDTKLPYEIYKRIEDTGEFAEFFIDLNILAQKEQHRVEKYLNDTKFYRGRLGANLKNDTIHIFYEEYNYSMPERNEYYLMEYINGHFCLSVSDGSMFMQEYLSQEEYEKHYYDAERFSRMKYESLDEIEKAISDSKTSPFQKDILYDRKGAFKALQKNVSRCLEELKDRKNFIRNLDYIYGNNPEKICYDYNLKNEFECTIEEDFEVVCGKLEADLTDKDGNCVKISFDELKRAFELGFADSEQICRVKRKKGSIESVLQ